MQNGFFRKTPPFPGHVRIRTESVRQRPWKKSRKGAFPLVIYCFIAFPSLRPGHSTVLDVSNAGYSKKSWSDPDTLERSKSFAIADENFITLGNDFPAFNFCGFNNGDIKTPPFAESEPHVR
ncbi:hypothetical protein AVEN_103498-1 [Araneus ventricosus]|uniref:Uncharacterized protein n=1 Tax=Araneus ventricosus TaxID=182803 RepID=A0A4Y2UJJ4_ARAVE|nr:hypothetical protein AVEN_73777-1 [Araneus ventricosus]GBO11826.1 hypothetical protein AVEN_103498-1 [Araneus ventricosus]